MGEDIRAYIDKSKSSYYDSIVENEKSPFFKHTKTDVFVAAAAIGYYLKKSEPISKRQDLFLVSTMSRDEKGRLWIMKSIAISIVGLEALKDLKKVIKICEEYANCGIDWLYRAHAEEVDICADLSEKMSDIINEEGI